MKTLKFTPDFVPLVLSGEKTSTMRLFDDKDLQVGDQLVLINKKTDEKFATAQVTSVREKRLGDNTSEDEALDGHEPLGTAEERLTIFRKHYGDRVTPDTMVKMIKYVLTA